MMRWIAFTLGVLLPAILLAEDELPQNPEEPLDIEPPLLIHEIPNRGPSQSDQVVAVELDPERIQAALEKARKNAAAGERLFRTGIIAKVDVENRALKVVRLEADLANARVETAKAVLGLYQEASAEMKKLGQAGKCWDEAEKEFKLPKYESMPGYANGLPFVARRYCGLWGRGT